MAPIPPLCPLCRIQPVTPQGEHVLPQWFLKAFFPEDKLEGYYVERNGEPETKKGTGETRRNPNVTRYILAVCNTGPNGEESQGCNHLLQQRFENRPTVAAVRKLFDQSGAPRTLDHLELQLASLWLLKTFLLLAHPLTRDSRPYEEPGVPPWTGLPETLWSWLIDPGLPPPPGLSLWISRHSRFNLTVDGAPTGTIHLPEVRYRNGDTTIFRAKTYAVSDVGVHLVYHPDWEIRHPMEEQDLAMRLWPSVPSSLDFEGLPVLSGAEERDWHDLFRHRVRVRCRHDSLSGLDSEPLHVDWQLDLLPTDGGSLSPAGWRLLADGIQGYSAIDETPQPP